MKTFRGGARIGGSAWSGIHGSWPFATLKVNPDTIEVTLFWMNFTFRRSEVVALETYRKDRFSRVQIRHRRTDVARWILFYPVYWQGAELKAELESLGWTITEVPMPTLYKVSAYVIVALIALGLLGVFAGMGGALAAFFKCVVFHSAQCSP